MTAGDQPRRHDRDDDDGTSTDSSAALESTFLRSVCVTTKKKPLDDNLRGSAGH